MARGKNKTEQYYFKISDTFDEFVEKNEGKLSYILKNFDEVSQFIRGYNNKQDFLVHPKFKTDKDLLKAFTYNLQIYHRKNEMKYSSFEWSNFKDHMCVKYFPHVSPDSI